jgi:DNA-binding LacI/PurR family transcriptional regulator
VRHPTIADIAWRAGVTKAAVSFALNGKPGVSAATRERILGIAAEIGFQPSSAARALSEGRAGAFGLVIDRPTHLLGIEPFFMQLVSGMQAELSRNHVTLLFTTTEDQAAEVAMYRSWWAQRRVDGVFLVDLQLEDRRVPALEELRMPALVIGAPEGSGSLPAIWQDAAAVTATVVGYLAELGHRRIARVTGIPRYWHTKVLPPASAPPWPTSPPTTSLPTKGYLIKGQLREAFKVKGDPGKALLVGLIAGTALPWPTSCTESYVPIHLTGRQRTTS